MLKSIELRPQRKCDMWRLLNSVVLNMLTLMIHAITTIQQFLRRAATMSRMCSVVLRLQDVFARI